MNSSEKNPKKPAQRDKDDFVDRVMTWGWYWATITLVLFIGVVVYRLVLS